MDMYKTTYHRDGTVTLWDVYSQTWQRLHVETLSHELLASLSERERARIERMVARERARA